MKVLVLALAGFACGAIAGGTLGVGLGLIWTGVSRCFEGYCRALVLFAFLPLGIVGGGLIGAFSLWYFGGGEAGGRRRDAN